MKRERELAKNTLIIAFGTILPKFASIITLPIITAQLTRIEYGVYDLVSTLVALVLPVITLQIQSASFRFLMECEYQEEKKKIISTIMIFLFMISTVALVTLLLVLNRMDYATKMLVIIYFEADVLLNVLQQIARGLHNNKLFSISAVIVSFVNMILILVSLQVFSIGLNGVLLSIGVATIIATCYLSSKLRIFSYIKFSLYSKVTLRQMLTYSWPMVPNSLSNWVMSLSDRLIITSVLGLEANAVYSVANKIPNLFTSIQGTFVMAWQENASIASKDEDIDAYYTKMFELTFGIFFAIMSCMIAFTPIIFKILVRGDYAEAYNQIPILYIALLFSAVASFIGGIYVAVKRTRSIGITTTVAAIINLLVNLSLVNFMGIYASSISTLISYFVLSIYRMKDIQRFVGIKYKYSKIAIMCVMLVIMVYFCYFKIIWLDILNIIVAIALSYYYNKDVINSNFAHRF